MNTTSCICLKLYIKTVGHISYCFNPPIKKNITFTFTRHTLQPCSVKAGDRRAPYWRVRAVPVGLSAARTFVLKQR